ncbi:MAG: hypothetical protein KDA90_20665 [Planctomycetaceae bacterium]|nr:hypothetical protein [Planctomycetaceae bacterium]
MNSFPSWFGVLSVMLLGLCSAAMADDPNAAATANSKLSEQEQAFADLLSNSVLDGLFTMDGKLDKAPKSEQYTIRGVTKVDGANWIITSQIKYGQHDVAVPVPVQVYWAGDTPMLQVTNLTIPLLGEGFSARVLFYDGRYAGTWQHGKVGGQMYGRVGKANEASAAEEK